MTEKVARVSSIVIASSPQTVWSALTDPQQTERWYFGTRVRSTFEVGAPIEYAYPDGSVALRGEVVECDPPHRLVHTFHAVWDDDVARDEPTLYAWVLEDAGDGLCRVTVEHSQIVPGSATAQQADAGRVHVLSALKTLVETGRTLEELVGAPGGG